MSSPGSACRNRLAALPRPCNHALYAPEHDSLALASLGHIAVGMAAARAYRAGQTPRWPAAAAMALWSGLSLLPDADVLGFEFGVRYASVYGHRGASHSIAFACLVALGAGLVAWIARLPAGRTIVAVGLVVLSHGILDTLTDGGRGCALLWPLYKTRYFAPVRPIPVAPIGFAFLSPIGLRVALTELMMFSPLLFYALWPRRAPTARAAPISIVDSEPPPSQP